jgi:hypothetical protein
VIDDPLIMGDADARRFISPVWLLRRTRRASGHRTMPSFTWLVSNRNAVNSLLLFDLDS